MLPLKLLISSQKINLLHFVDLISSEEKYMEQLLTKQQELDQYEQLVQGKMRDMTLVIVIVM